MKTGSTTLSRLLLSSLLFAGGACGSPGTPARPESAPSRSAPVAGEVETPLPLENPGNVDVLPPGIPSFSIESASFHRAPGADRASLELRWRDEAGEPRSVLLAGTVLAGAESLMVPARVGEDGSAPAASAEPPVGVPDRETIFAQLSCLSADCEHLSARVRRRESGRSDSLREAVLTISRRDAEVRAVTAPEPTWRGPVGVAIPAAEPTVAASAAADLEDASDRYLRAARLTRIRIDGASPREFLQLEISLQARPGVSPSRPSSKWLRLRSEPGIESELELTRVHFAGGMPRGQTARLRAAVTPEADGYRMRFVAPAPGAWSELRVRALP